MAENRTRRRDDRNRGDRRPDERGRDDRRQDDGSRGERSGATRRRSSGRSDTADKGKARSDGRVDRHRSLNAGEVARLAMEQVVGLTGRDPDGVTSLERTDDGWSVGVEVVETHRIPDSADILATYEVDLDGAGGLVAYRRVRRYSRSQVDRE